MLAATDVHAQEQVPVRLRSSAPAFLEARGEGEDGWKTVCREGESTRLRPGTALRVRTSDGTLVSTLSVPREREGIELDVTRPPPAAMRVAGIGLVTLGGGALVTSLDAIFVTGFRRVMGSIGQDSCSSFDNPSPASVAACEGSREAPFRRPLFHGGLT